MKTPCLLALVVLPVALLTSPVARAQSGDEAPPPAADDSADTPDPSLVPGATISESAAQNNDDSGASSRSSGAIIGQPGAGYGTGFTVSALGGIGSYEAGFFGLGLGGFFGIPIVRDGFIPSLNESFHLEVGMITNIVFTSFGEFGYLSPVGGVRWDFHILESFTAYAALRSGIALGIDIPTDFYFDTAVGGFWRFSQPVAVRFELGGGVVGSFFVSGGIAFFL